MANATSNRRSPFRPKIVLTPTVSCKVKFLNYVKVFEVFLRVAPPILTMASLAAVVLRNGGRLEYVSARSWKVAGRRNFSPMAWYNKKLEKAPIITKSITSGSKCHSCYLLAENCLQSGTTD